MFNLGFSEIVALGVLALVLIGPKQLPEVARTLGRLMNEFKKATHELSGGLLEIKKDLKGPMQDVMSQVKSAMQEPMDEIQENIVDPMQDLKRSARQHMRQVSMSDEVVRIKEDLKSQVEGTTNKNEITGEQPSVQVIASDETTTKQ